MVRVIVCVFLLALQSCNVNVQKEEPVFWVWVHSNQSNWESVFDKLSDVGIEAVLVENASHKLLEEIIPIASRVNIKVHLWYWTLNRADIASIHPEWLSVNALGQSLAEKKAYVDYYKFLCPAIPGVQQYILDEVESYCKIKGLSGIHLDYVRYVDRILPVGLQPKYDLIQDQVFPEFDYGYHPYLIERYQDEMNVDFFDKERLRNDVAWRQFRLNQVSILVDSIKNLTKAYGKDLTAAVFPTPDMASNMVLQDWGKWPLDAAFPMLYNGFYNEPIDWIGKSIESCKMTSSVIDGNIFSGLFIPAFKGNRDSLRYAMDVSFQAGATGICFFDYNSISADSWNEIKKMIVAYRKTH